MGKSIETLVEDIYGLLDTNVEVTHATNFGYECADRFAQFFCDEPQPKGTLRFSSLGRECDRYHWLDVNKPESAEPFPDNIRIMFFYGHLVEAMALTLARAAGHTVEHEQLTVEVEGVRGSLDAVIDGVLVDVKSCNSWTFDKIMAGDLEKEDKWGYLSQLSSYAKGLQLKGIEFKGTGFLCVDKGTGRIGYREYDLTRFITPKSLEVEYKKTVVVMEECPPVPYEPTDVGKSGNKRVPSPCDICVFKKECWKYRTFLYGEGTPREKELYLTHVKREPDVREIKT